jgi:putative DNA primase/helicase
MWKWCDKDEALHASKLVSEKLLEEGRHLFPSDQERGSHLIKHAMRSHDLKRLEAMLKLAASEPGMSAAIKEFDSDPWLLGVSNGVVDLRTSTLLRNNPDMLITRQCNALYDIEARCPRWQLFLEEIFNGDLDTIETVQRALGYSLTGIVTEEVLFICFGHGSNGKSVFNNVISAIFGNYVRVAPSSLLTIRRDGDSSPRNDLASLAGARYVTINELQSGDRLDEQIVKLLAGREKIAARFLHKEFFEFSPTFKPWLRTNHKPIITGDNDGIWRRLVLIPFSQQFTDKNKDPYLEDKLLVERDAILAWMIEGAKKWKKDGLQLSKRILSECASYRKDSDLLGEFVDEICTVNPNEKTEQPILYGQYRTWCNNNGVRPIAKASFTRRLAERGFLEKKSNGKRYYGGLQISIYLTSLPSFNSAQGG